MRVLQWFVVISLFVAQSAWADPPSRAARVSGLTGQAQLHYLSEGTHSPLDTNLSLGGGYAIETDRFARVELRIGSTILRLDEETELEIVRLDDQRIDLRLNYGSLAVQISNPAVLAELSVETRLGRLQWQALGSSRVKIERRSDNSNLSVFSGKVLYVSGSNQLLVSGGHQADFYNEDVTTSQVAYNDFDRWSQSRDLPAAANQTTLRYVSNEATGYEELERHGNWTETIQYGAVWQPHQRNWTPYRHGEWRWIAPWGWTWVDQTPWAYVTSHYGRWVWLEQSWAWVPGALGRNPAWSPALVGWVSNGQVVHSPSITGNVSWFPLGPREVWIPSYAYSQQYAFRFNRHYLPHQHHGHIAPPVTYIYRDRHVPARHNQFSRSATVNVPAAPRPVTVVNSLPVAEQPPAAHVAPRAGPVQSVMQRVVNEVQRAANQPAMPAQLAPAVPVAPVAAPVNAPISLPPPHVVRREPREERPQPHGVVPAAPAQPVRQVPAAPMPVAPAPVLPVAPVVARPAPVVPAAPVMVGPAPNPAANAEAIAQQKAKEAREARKRDEEAEGKKREVGTKAR